MLNIRHTIKKLTAVAIFILLLSNTGVMSETIDNDNWRYFRVFDVESDDVLNIRSEPTSSSQTIGSFQHNESLVEILGKDSQGRWAMVNLNAGVGWTYLRYLEPIVIPTFADSLLPNRLFCEAPSANWTAKIDGISLLLDDSTGVLTAFPISSTEVKQNGSHLFLRHTNGSSSEIVAADSNRAYELRMPFEIRITTQNKTYFGGCRLDSNYLASSNSDRPTTNVEGNTSSFEQQVQNMFVMAGNLAACLEAPITWSTDRRRKNAILSEMLLLVTRSNAEGFRPERLQRVFETEFSGKLTGWENVFTRNYDSLDLPREYFETNECQPLRSKYLVQLRNVGQTIDSELITLLEDQGCENIDAEGLVVKGIALNQNRCSITETLEQNGYHCDYRRSNLTSSFVLECKSNEGAITAAFSDLESDKPTSVEFDCNSLNACAASISDFAQFIVDNTSIPSMTTRTITSTYIYEGFAASGEEVVVRDPAYSSNRVLKVSRGNIDQQRSGGIDLN